MKTVEAIINRFINEEGLKYNQERDDWVIEAMEEYAKEARIEENKLWLKATKLDYVTSFNFKNRILELKGEIK